LDGLAAKDFLIAAGPGENKPPGKENSRAGLTQKRRPSGGEKNVQQQRDEGKEGEETKMDSAWSARKKQSASRSRRETGRLRLNRKDAECPQ